ncbi:hypothetical protein DL93DRAFT_2081315 [Clavulina sp. PMI_390]|nr:hypothetical protein DL93DRAFT_2081315 [Clavulina sp. PMI_390]
MKLSQQNISPQDALTFTSARSRARFDKDRLDFGVTLLRLLLLDDGYLSLREMFDAQTEQINGWPSHVQDLAVGILSSFIASGKGDLNSDDKLSPSPPTFGDAVSRFKQLLFLIRLHSPRGTTTSVSIFAERLRPISFPSAPPTIAEILIQEVSNPKSIHREFYALLRVKSGGDKTWAITKRSLWDNEASDTITFCRKVDLLHGMDDEVMMACKYESLALPTLAGILAGLNKGALNDSPFPYPS